MDVYFDDFKVTQVHSNVVAGADYYPFGLVMSTREITQEPYRYGYQGQYSEKDNDTGYNSFELRQYDARTGRWISGDPYGQYNSPYLGMGNNPVNGVDPSGGLFGVGWSDFKAFLFGGNWEVGRSWGWTPGLFNNLGEFALGSGDFLNSGTLVGATNAVITDEQLKKLAEQYIPKEIPDDMRKKIKENVIWHVDYDGKGGTYENQFHAVYGNTEAANKNDPNTALTVYVHPNTFKNRETYAKREKIIKVVIGHEWIHITHYRSAAYANWRRNYPGFASKISEAKAHNWSYNQDPSNESGLNSREEFKNALDGWPTYRKPNTPLDPSSYFFDK